jgi:deoxycytidylate deaminase
MAPAGREQHGEELRLFLAAAALARRGDQRGAKHGCLLVLDSGDGFDTAGGGGSGSGSGARVLGEGWNHEVREQRSAANRKLHRKRVLHAECHAVADAIRRHGEDAAFAALKRCTAWIVELKDDAAYDDAPPCRKCTMLLQALGVPRAAHSTREGALRRVVLAAPRPELLALDMACKPLSYACDALGVRCERLERALQQVYDAGGAGGGQGAKGDDAGGRVGQKRRKQHATPVIIMKS